MIPQQKKTKKKTVGKYIIDEILDSIKNYRVTSLKETDLPTRVLKSVSNTNFCNLFFGKSTVYLLSKSIGKEVQKVNFCQYRKPCFSVADNFVMVQLKDTRTYTKFKNIFYNLQSNLVFCFRKSQTVSNVN